MSQIDKVLNNCKKYLGTKEGSSSHIRILNVYNNHRPLARGYTVKSFRCLVHDVHFCYVH